MESTESRFAHLLQPIRELTKNWDIDVAAELNDYLEEVRHVQRSSGCRTERPSGAFSADALLRPCVHALGVTPSGAAQEWCLFTKVESWNQLFLPSHYLSYCLPDFSELRFAF